MFSLGTAQTVLVVSLSLFTAVAAVSDLRFRKIPNKLTVPAFALGLVFQIVFHPHAPGMWGALGDAAAAFGLGFGTLFVLWLMGGGGGGDAKLMGALSVWLGWKMTVAVLIVSTIFVLAGTAAVIGWTFVRNGARGAKESLAPGRGGDRAGSLVDRQNRRVMTYALPVALATWLVLFWFHWKGSV